MPVRPAIDKTISPVDLFEMIDKEPIEPVKTEVQISGKITNHRMKDAKIILYPDPVSMKQVEFNLFVKTDGTFFTKLKISEPTIGKLEYGSRIVELYIEPGDDLKINFAANDFLNSLKFTGVGGNHNNFLKELRTNFTNEDKESGSKIYSEKNPMAFKRFLKKIYKTKKAFYNDKIHLFSYDFSQYAKAQIDYWYAYNLTNYRWEHPLNWGQPAPLTIRDHSYYDYMDEIPLNNEFALPNEYYVQYLDVYLDDKKKEIGLNKVELASMYFEGRVKYFYQAKVLASSARNGQLIEVLFDIKTFMDFCNYQPLRESMKSALRDSKTLLPGMVAPDFKLMNEKGKEVSLSDFRGKIVYVDFWATWCTPCTRQISNTTDLRRQYIEKGVVFLYVSVDYTESEWKNYVKRHNLTGDHVYAKGGLNSGAALDYGVKQLPAAFILDREGKIVKNNSMKSPTSYGLKGQLNKLLGE